jgi:hypothetical protein
MVKKAAWKEIIKGRTERRSDIRKNIEDTQDYSKQCNNNNNNNNNR